MKPLYLRLKGFTGIYRATGHHEVELDLLGLEADQKLVAFVGANGSAKSTVLDNLHPYPVMPSRMPASSDTDGPISLSAFSYYPNLNALDCARELIWEHDGIRYRTSQTWHINGSKSAEAYLHELDGEKWKPVALPDGTLSDGKVSTYTKCVEGILGSAATYFTTHFAAQNRALFSKYKTGDMKALLSDVLGHKHIEALHAKALTVNSSLKGSLALARDEFEEVREALARAVALAASLRSDEAKLLQAAQRVSQARDAVAQATIRLSQAQELAQSEIATNAERGRLGVEKTQTTDSRRADLLKLQAEKAALEKGLADAELQLRRSLARLQTEEAAVTKHLVDQDALLARSADIEAAATAIPEAHAAVELLRPALEAAEQTLAEQGALNQQKHRVELDLRKVGEALGITKEKQQTLALQSGLADEVPCVGTDLQSKCKLLTSAVSAKTDLPKTVELVDKRELEYNAKGAELASIVARLGAVGDVAKAVADIRKALATAEQQVVQLEKAVALKPMVEAAGSAKLVALGRREELAAERVSVAKAIAEATEAADAQREAATQRQRQHQDETAALLAKIDAAVAKLPTATGASAVAAAQAGVTTTKATLTLEEDANANLQESVAKAKGTLASITATPTGLTLAKAQVDALDGEIAGWALLTKGLSKDGILALSIDDAGPTLSAYANELLTACYGPRFTVAIETQIATATGGVREGFDILVDDQTSGTRASLGLMSGGERVWINECISRALSLYLAQSGGVRQSTLFTDETDGPLDEEHKRMFIAMKRKVLELGGYEREFFVSHTPAMWDQADCVLKFPDVLVPVPGSTAAEQGVLYAA